MPFFWHIDILQRYISKKYKKNKPSLRERNPEFLTLKTYNYLYTYLKKRVSSFISCHSLKASMTMEAALVLPCFLFAIISLISIMDIMKIKGCMDVAVAEAGNEIAIEGYGGLLNEMVTPFYIKQKIITFLEKNLSAEAMEKVSADIHVLDLSFVEDNGVVSFRVDYNVNPNFRMPGIASVRLNATYYGYKWIGYKVKEEAENMVFISDSASVYHLDKRCKYLNVTITEIKFENLEKYRNNSREKYKDCNFCKGIAYDRVVYITPEGSNYHTIKNCIGLTRSIHTVPLSSVSDKRVCSGCGE